MEPNAIMILRVVKRLKTAVGYHELGMSRHALRWLESAQQLDTAGPFGLVAEVLRQQFAQYDEDHVAPANNLEIAVRALPDSARLAFELTLAICYGQPDDKGRVANIGALTRGLKPEAQPKPAH